MPVIELFLIFMASSSTAKTKASGENGHPCLGLTTHLDIGGSCRRGAVYKDLAFLCAELHAVAIG